MYEVYEMVICSRLVRRYDRHESPGDICDFPGRCPRKGWRCSSRGMRSSFTMPYNFMYLNMSEVLVRSDGEAISTRRPHGAKHAEKSNDAYGSG